MQFIVTGGPHPVENLPVCAVVERALGDVNLSSGGRSAAAQIETADGKTIVHWIIDKLGAAEQRVYEVVPTSGEKPTGVEIGQMDDERLEVKVGGGLLTR